jgi:hypothetical protein
MHRAHVGRCRPFLRHSINKAVKPYDFKLRSFVLLPYMLALRFIWQICSISGRHETRVRFRLKYTIICFVLLKFEFYRQIIVMSNVKFYENPSSLDRHATAMLQAL